MTTQLAPDRLALPPPLALDLVDAGRTTGWIADNAVGFRGFGDETEATFTRFVYKRNWFVLAQTEGKPYTGPAPAAWNRTRALGDEVRERRAPQR